MTEMGDGLRMGPADGANRRVSAVRIFPCRTVQAKNLTFSSVWAFQILVAAKGGIEPTNCAL